MLLIVSVCGLFLVSLTQSERIFLFLGLFISNLIFFVACFLGIVSSFRAFLRERAKRCYLFCCLCGNRKALANEIKDYEKGEENLNKIKQIEYI